MLNSGKGGSVSQAATHVWLSVCAIFFACLLTGTYPLQAATGKVKAAHHTTVHKKHKKHKKASHKTNHTRSHSPKKVSPNTSAMRSVVHTYPVFASHTGHSLALVNTLHLASTTPERSSNNRTITPAQKNLVDFVDHTVYNLRYNNYRLGGGRFDTSHGIYVVDCSRFVDRVLSRIYPAAYTNLVNASGADQPATQHYYDFFADLSANSDDVHWNRVDKIGQLRPGDILVFRYKKPRGRTQGHVMVVMDKPHAARNAWLVRVADSAPIRHSADTRQAHESGIGIGTLLLKPTPAGKPAAYAWEMGGVWKRNVKFAMARPLKMDV